MEDESFWTWMESLSRTFAWEERATLREGHVGQDGGAHHIIPGYGRHPEIEAPPVREDLEAAHEQGDRPKSKIGKETGRDRSVYYDPNLPQASLANAHLTITGESGTGKTQVMKTLLADLRGHGVPSLVLDFKDDYAEPKYAGTEGFTAYDPAKRPLPFNPLEPLVDPQSGEANKTFHTYQLAEIVARVYRLGEQQQFKLREAIKASYEEAGDAIPTFDDVKTKLAADKGSSELLGRLSPIFDFGFFSDPDPAGFTEIIGGNTVIRLAQLPSNEVKNSVAEFFLMALYNHLVRLEQTHLLRQVLVLDEAWRVVQSPFLEPLMREARAFGLGVFVATQFPTDLPLAVSGSAATDIYLGQSTPSQIAEVQQSVAGSTNSAEAERLATVLRGLLPLQCIVRNRQYDPYVKVDARPYYARGFEAKASVVIPGPALELPRPSSRFNLNHTKGSSVRLAGSPGDHNIDRAGHLYSLDDQVMGGEGYSYCGKARAHPSEQENIEWGERLNDFADGFDVVPCKECFEKAGEPAENPWNEGESYRACPHCSGDGCGYCDDTGLWPRYAVKQTRDCHVCSGSGKAIEGASEYNPSGNCYSCEGRGKVEWGGRAHDIEPEDESINYIDFDPLEDEEGDKMPESTTPRRTTWHNKMLDIIGKDHGIKVDDLKVEPNWTTCECEGKDGDCWKCKGSGLYNNSGDPDWGEVGNRLNAIGLDTYDSDTRFEVYNGKANCDEEECHDGLEGDGATPFCPSCGRQSWDNPKKCGDSFHKAAKVAQARPEDDGMIICNRCGTGTSNKNGTCDACMELASDFVDSSEQSLEDRIEKAKSKDWNVVYAEMIKFPPGEDEEEDNPFTPFSMSEWQMVKGPRHRR